MNRRSFVGLAVAGCLAFPGSAAFAKDAGWDGTWTGVTQKGGDVVIAVSGGQVSYRFRGSSVAVNSASVSGSSLTLSVGSLNGKVSVKKTGADTASYSYSDPNGGSAAATLERR